LRHIHFECGFQPVGQRLKITKIGDVAQLARALGWQPRGRRFEPDLLHIILLSNFFGRKIYFKPKLRQAQQSTINKLL
jgi:hypothetical protein